MICDWFIGDHPRNWEKLWLLDPIRRTGQLGGLREKPEWLRHFEKAGEQLIHDEDLSRQVQMTWCLIGGRALWCLMKQPAAWRFAWDRPVTAWRSALAILQTALAYRTGVLRYGNFVVRAEGR